MLKLLRTARVIIRHPLNKARPVRALARYCRWQLTSRLASSPLEVPFVGKSRLLVSRGMRGATGNIYCGLAEFPEMSFILHLLRPGDLFVDVGANVGVYTVLASAVTRAHTLAIEPSKEACRALAANVQLNRIEALVETHAVGAADRDGSLAFTSGLDAINHVMPPGDAGSNLQRIPVRTLDELLDSRTPTALKVDVEGFETAVIGGAARTLQSQGLIAMIVEMNGSGSRYGYDEDQLDRRLQGMGFGIYWYDPFSRALTRMDRRQPGNVLYVRDVEEACRRLQAAEPFCVHGYAL